MKDLIRMFPDVTRQNRKRIEDDPDNLDFGRGIASDFWKILIGCLMFAVVAVVVFILMGGLKLLGVKTLE